MKRGYIIGAVVIFVLVLLWNVQARKVAEQKAIEERIAQETALEAERLFEANVLMNVKYELNDDNRITMFDAWKELRLYFARNNTYPDSFQSIFDLGSLPYNVTYEQLKEGQGYLLCQRPSEGHTQCVSEIDTVYPFKQ